MKFYFSFPSFVGPILAVGSVKTAPKEEKLDPAKDKSKMVYRSDIDQVRFLNNPLTLEELIEKFEDWKYLTYPRAAHYVPAEIAPNLMKIVKDRISS